MRCIAIATACIKRGQQCVFLLAEEKETQKLKEQAIPYCILHIQWYNMESEKEKLEQVILEEKLDYNVVDSYQVTDKCVK